jgi:hypothetical protein
MSYDFDDIKPGFVPLKSMVSAWQAIDRELLEGVETEQDRKLWRKCQDDCISDIDREKRRKRSAEKYCDFVHTLSYNRSIGYISRTDKKQLYNGSTFNRKPAAEKPMDPWQVAYALASEDEQQKMDIEKDYALYRCNRGVQFYQYEYTGSRLTGYTELPPKPKKDNSKHTTSKRTKDKIKEKMLALYRACSGKKGYRSHVVNFTLCTLTFVAPVDDRKGVECLNKFLTVLRDRYGKFAYIWVAERQGNGNIHFHMIADSRFPIGYINSLWVAQQYNCNIRNWESDYQLNEDHRTNFANLHTEGKYHLVQDYLNPVDIRNVKTIDGVSCYLTNYVTMNTDSFDCSAWHCSRTVSKIFTNKIIDKKIFDKTGDSKHNTIFSKKTGQVYTNTTYYGQYCTINTIYNKTYYRRYLEDLELINKYILELDDKIDSDEVRKVISVDNEDYRKRFLQDISIQN